MKHKEGREEVGLRVTPGHKDKGPFINDVMQEEGGGMHFCYTLNEGVGKTPILA